jgi:hypothetical protein
MRIIIKDNRRILIKDNNEELEINNGSIIEYMGMNYKPKLDGINIYDIDECETRFIGKIETDRAVSEEITGIYVLPLYMWDLEWIKISNYQTPKNKYFLYPHLLMLPDKYYHYYPLYFLHTCEAAKLDKLNNITKTIALEFMN